MQKATCPLALSFIFKAELPHGSIGVGCTIDKRVVVSASESEKNSFIFNGKNTKLPTVSYALKQLTNKPIKLTILSPLPLACGFGVSGASTLASVFAVKKLLNLKKTDKNLTYIAHIAEIKNKTGLGTVATQIIGGFLVKKRPGIEPLFNRLNLTGAKIWATTIGTLKTPSILANDKQLKKINHAALWALKIIMNEKNISFNKILDISYEFTLRAGLITNKKTKKIIESIHQRGGHATMAILGETVLSNIAPLRGIGYPTYELTVTNDKINEL